MRFSLFTIKHDSRSVMWLSLVAGGYLLSFVIPTKMIFGFSVGVFFAALAYSHIGFMGLGFYYVLYLTNDTMNWVILCQQMVTVAHEGWIWITTTNMNRVINVFWKPSFQQAQLLSENLKAYAFISSGIPDAITFVVYMALFFVLPIFWFYSCRKIIKKLQITRRLGLIR